MDSRPGCNICAVNLIRVLRLGTFSSAINRHDALTTVSLANGTFATSVPGVGSKLYSSCVCVFTFVFVLLFRSVSFPFIELRHSLAWPRLTGFGLIASLSNQMTSVTLNSRRYIVPSLGKRWCQLLASVNVSIYSAKCPPVLVAGSYSFTSCS